MQKYLFEDIKGQVVIITGSGRGIGQAMAKLFGLHGAKVLVTDVDEDVCKSTVKEIQEAGGTAMDVVGNITKEEDAKNIAETAIKNWRKIDCLINNAGITMDGLFIRMNTEQWKSVIDVNLNGTYFCTRHVINHMRKARKGSIINVSSVSRLGNPGQINYSSAKAGIIGFSKTLARELGSLGIRTNVLSPGYVETRLTAAVPQKAAEEIKQRIPMKRIALPEEIAYPALFLASNMSTYVNGCILEVNGGIVL